MTQMLGEGLVCDGCGYLRVEAFQESCKYSSLEEIEVTEGSNRR